MIWRYCCRIALLAVAVLAACGIEARAEKRIALVIGNSTYEHVARLPNPANDGAAIARLFKSAGFDVVELRRDLGSIDFKRALREFTLTARDSDIAIVFFAGHGIEVGGINYLVPVDAKLASDIDAEDEAVSLDRVLRALEPARRLRLVILDACRDNPFARAMRRTVTMRAIGGGGAKVEPLTADTLIAFAAKAGSTAEDGVSPNSPFTTALLKHLAEPGLDLQLAFRRVRDEVLRSTMRKQEPYVYGSLGGDTISLVPPVIAPPSPPPPGPDELAWGFLKDSTDAGAVKRFVERFPESALRGEAEARIASLVAIDRQRREQVEHERLDRERAAREQAERERLDRERIAREDAEKRRRERQQQEQADRERAAHELAAKQKAEREPAPRAEEENKPRAGVQAESNQTPADQKNAQTAMLPPSAEPPSSPAKSTPSLSGGALVQEIKKELARVGCYAGRVDEKWTSGGTKESVQKFARYAKLPSAPHEPSSDFLDVLRGKPGRVCPLECGGREIEKDGRCVAKTCPTGQRLGRDGKCIVIAERAPARRDGQSPASGGKCFTFGGKKYCE